MTITYSFKINNINCYTKYETLDKLAFNVWWDYIGTDGTNSSYVSGNTLIPYDPNTDYVPYEQLTEAEVISWVEQYTDPAELESAKILIEGRIEEASKPALIINPKLPWDV